MILLGHRKGTPLPAYPSKDKAVTGAPTCRDALADLPNADTFDELWNTDEVLTKKWGTPSDYAKHLRCLEPKSWAPNMRAKTASPEKVAIYLAQYINKVAADFAPYYSHD